MDRWYLDACSLLNLYATGRLKSIMEVLEFTFCVTPWVMEKETLYVYERQGTSQGPQVLVDLSELLNSGGLSAEPELSTDAELDLLIELSLVIDQGEAETISAVIARGGGLITDDGKAAREIAKRSPNSPVMTSVGILKQWSETLGISRAELREVLLNMQIGGNFIPGRKEKNLLWWKSVIDD